MEPDYCRRSRLAEIGALGRLLAPGRSMSENNEASVIAANAIIAKRADILFEIAEAEKRIE